MLHIHHANRFETLNALLLAHLGRGPADVFATEQVIVPSTAVRRALTLSIAQHRGICTLVQWSYLAQWLWQQMACCVPGVPAQSPYAPPALAWRVHAALCDASFVAQHPRLAHYLHDADALMRFDLARRIAALLDQLLTYRSDWLATWSAGRSVLQGAADAGAMAPADEAWQAALWRRCSDELAAQSPPPLDLLTRFGQVLDAAHKPAGLPDQAHVFALPTMPPLHIDLLHKMGRHLDLHVYVLNPCREYWFELVAPRQLSHLAARGSAQGHEVGNRLLATWGRQTQSHIDSLIDGGGDTVLDDSHFEPHPGSSLLAQWQNSVLDLTELAAGSVALADDDRSIELHVCHSLTRELEALADHLLGLFSAAQSSGQPLPASQVLVVTPDIEAAAPLIDAVFSTLSASRRIPYTVTGRARSHSGGPAGVLLSLLDLARSRCSASQVLAVLQQPPVARRFGLDDEQLPRVRAAMQASGMRWGLNSAHRASHGVPGGSRHTLGEGLARLFLGYACPDTVNQPFNGLLPTAHAEGSQAGWLGALQAFIDALAGLHHALAQPRPPSAWEGLLLGVLDDFMQAQGDELDEMRELRTLVHELISTMQRGSTTQAVAAPVLRAALQQLLDDPARGGVPTGRVTFSAISSLRNLPYAVVCAIGLNDGAFPSADRPQEFDLMARQPRRGDRQRRSDERNLFLDLLLAARHSVYLSHSGRSVRDNAPLPPSVLVSELLDVLVPAIACDPDSPAALAGARQRLVVEHPLQAFALESFTPGAEPRIRSHDEGLAQALRASLRTAAEGVPPPARSQHTGAQRTAQDADADAADSDADDDSIFEAEPLAPFFSAPLPAPDAPWRDVPLARLAEFLRNPCRSLLRRRLGLALARDEDLLPDDEPLLPDWPGRTALAERLLPALLRGEDATTVAALARAGTEWPGGAVGEALLTDELARLTQFADKLRAATAEPCQPAQDCRVEVFAAGQAWTLHTRLDDLRPGGLVRGRYDDTRPADHLQAWLLHLVLAAAAPQGVAPITQWISRDGAFSFGPVADAPAVLGTLLALYARGLCEPVHFFPKSAWAFMVGQQNWARARGRWRCTQHTPHGEEADPAYALALRGVDDPLDADFQACAVNIFGPLLACLQDPRVQP